MDNLPPAPKFTLKTEESIIMLQDEIIITEENIEEMNLTGQSDQLGQH